MTNSEEEIYSIMFSSLKHPVRRKILRMLSDKPTSFSKMLEELGISSSHLTYHLENLGELVSKTNDGNYQLSKFGEASVDTMKVVEEAPVVRSQGFTLKWKSVLAIALIAIVFLTGFSVFQYNNLNEIYSENNILKSENIQLNIRLQQLLDLTSDTDKAIAFIRDVVQLDISKYQLALVSNDVEFRDDLGGIVEESLRYTLVSSEDRSDVVLRFRDQFLSRYQIYVFEGSPDYYEPQPINLVDSASNLLERYKTYGNASYLDQMSDLLSMVDEVKNVSITDDNNMKLTVSTTNKDTTFFWLYTQEGVDFSPKSLSFVYENRELKQMTDGWFLFETGSTEVNVSRDEAITLAREAAGNFTWEYGGEIIGNFTILEVPVDAEFHPHPRDDFLNLIPYWYVTLYLDDIYPGEINRIAVGLWGDTGEISDIKAVAI